MRKCDYESLTDHGTAAYGELKRGSLVRTHHSFSFSPNIFKRAPLRRDDGTTDWQRHDCSPRLVREDRFKQTLHTGDTTIVP
jgi:hypothetical protein